MIIRDYETIDDLYDIIWNMSLRIVRIEKELRETQLDLLELTKTLEKKK